MTNTVPENDRNCLRSPSMPCGTCETCRPTKACPWCDGTGRTEESRRQQPCPNCIDGRIARAS